MQLEQKERPGRPNDRSWGLTSAQLMGEAKRPSNRHLKPAVLRKWVSAGFGGYCIKFPGRIQLLHLGAVGAVFAARKVCGTDWTHTALSKISTGDS